MVSRAGGGETGSCSGSGAALQQGEKVLEVGCSAG